LTRKNANQKRHEATATGHNRKRGQVRQKGDSRGSGLGIKKRKNKTGTTEGAEENRGKQGDQARCAILDVYRDSSPAKAGSECKKRQESRCHSFVIVET
jgi:hypothetical protein